VGYKICLHTNTDQPERHKYKMKSIKKKIFMTRKNITYKAEHRLDNKKIPAYVLLIQLTACCWGSIHNGNRELFVVKIPFCTEWSSAGRPLATHPCTVASEVNRPTYIWRYMCKFTYIHFYLYIYICMYVYIYSYA
jgi:hypothetical protein